VAVTGLFDLLSFLSVVRDCKNVELSFSDVTSKTDLLRGTKKGTIYLTPYRVQHNFHYMCCAFNTAVILNKDKDVLLSFVLFNCLPPPLLA